jgi:hypothetical protein
MILDAQLLFSDAQALTASAASTSSVDLGAVRNLGVGENLYIVLTVDVALTDSGSNSTVTVDLQGDSTTTFTPDGTQTLFSIAALAAAGTVYIARIAPGLASNYRYLQLYYTMVNGDLSTGTVTAFITHDVAAYSAYADNITIS